MLVSAAVKRFTVPFSPEKIREPFSSEVEAAAVFALAESERGKGGGLIIKQPEEKLVTLAKVGYPLWLFPRNDSTFVFDGLDNCRCDIPYAEMPAAHTFLENLNENAKTKETYMTFLSDNGSFFLQQSKEKKFRLRGLIGDPEFKNELGIYRKQAVEIPEQTSTLLLLQPALEEGTVQSTMAELDKLLLSLHADAAKLPEIQRLLNKTTSQYMTEIEYGAQAVKEEADAKIKAQEELVNPQVTKLTIEYKKRMKSLAESFDNELENLRKLQVKTKKFIEADEQKNRQYEHEAKVQAQKNHLIYEKRWKEKSKEVERELSGLKKEQKNVEKNIQTVTKRRTTELAQLNFELDAEIKLARQPLIQLAASRDAKMGVFREQTERLIKLERPIVEAVSKSLAERERIISNFEIAGIKDRQLKTVSLLYIPFYAFCFEAGLSRRYLILAPSSFGSVDFSAKLKGVFGMSKIRSLISPRFSSISSIIETVQGLAKQNSIFEGHLSELGEKNNLLRSPSFAENARRGLVYLKHEGWLSEKEQWDLSSRLAT